MTYIFHEANYNDPRLNFETDLYLFHSLCSIRLHRMEDEKRAPKPRGKSTRESGSSGFVSICAWQDSGPVRGSLLQSFGAPERTLTGLLPPSVGLSAHSPEYALHVLLVLTGVNVLIIQADKISPNVRTRNQSTLFRRFLVRWTRIWPQNCSIMSGFWNILI